MSGARIAALAVALAAAGCTVGTKVGRGPASVTGIAPDSVSAGLWRMDETGGTSVADAGRQKLAGRAGVDTRTEFGRVRGARVFTRTIDSFVYVPYDRAFESGQGLTVEAWILLNAYGQYEDTPIAGRWTQQANEQSWMFSVLGLNTKPPMTRLPSPGFHDRLVLQGTVGPRGRLMFAVQLEDASPPRACFSTRGIPLDKWTHVAASFDEEVVRIWIDGELDAQYVVRGRIRSTRAGLLVGNYFDPRWLSDFGGDLRISNAPDMNPYYAFEGLIDELRVSTVARADFAYARSATGVGK